MDFTPRTSKIELHLTYRCNLTCASCSRASYLRKPHTEDMTIEDAREVFRQCDELGWQPLVILIGGEPTAHPQFLDFARISREWMKRQNRVGPCSEVQVYSNGHSERERRLCDEAREKYDCSIVKSEWKPEGSRVGGEPDMPDWHLGMFVSPTDAGLPFQGTCYCHSAEICGAGADHYGYSVCPTGLSIGALLEGQGVLAAPVRTKRLADLFDPAWAEAATKAMCSACGYGVSKRHGKPEEREAFARYVESCEQRNGTPMSPTWLKAFEGKKWPGPNGEKDGTLDRPRLPMVR